MAFAQFGQPEAEHETYGEEMPLHLFHLDRTEAEDVTLEHLNDDQQHQDRPNPGRPLADRTHDAVKPTR